MIYKMSTLPCVGLLIWFFVGTGVTSQESGSVRLADGPNLHSGRVEVFLDGQWGTVRNDSWGIRDGQVVCRQLGYSGVDPAQRDASYGAGTGPIHIGGVMCSGPESQLIECDHTSLHNTTYGHGEVAGVACYRSPMECGFSDDGSSGKIVFKATRRGTCSLTIESTIDELIMMSVQSYAFRRNIDGDCVNDVEVYEDDHEIDSYCGFQNSSKDYVVHANRFEIRIRTRSVNQPSSLEANFHKVDSSVSCDFVASNRCDISKEGAPWTRGTNSSLCNWYDGTVTDRSYRADAQCGGNFSAPNGEIAKCDPCGDYPCCSPYNWCGITAEHCDCDGCVDFRGAFLETEAGGATFTLPIMPSREVALFFGYASSDCRGFQNDLPLIVGFCEIPQQVPSGGYFFKRLYCDDPVDTITLTVETTSCSFVYVGDIRLWYLDGTDTADSSVPTTSSNDGASSITDAGGAPTSKNSAKSGNNAMLNDGASSLVVYVIPAVLVTLVLLAAIIGFVIVRRRRKSRTTAADANVSYNNRTYDTGSPIQTPVSGDQFKNGIIAAADKEEVYNPAYQSNGAAQEDVYNVAYESSDGPQQQSDAKEEVYNDAYRSGGDAKGDLYNVAYESSDGPQQPRDAKEEASTPAYQSSGDKRGEVYNVAYESSVGSEQRNEAGTVEDEHDYAVPGPGSASEYQYVDYKK